jgi:hypothetical protein
MILRPLKVNSYPFFILALITIQASAMADWVKTDVLKNPPAAGSLLAFVMELNDIRVSGDVELLKSKAGPRLLGLWNDEVTTHLVEKAQDMDFTRRYQIKVREVSTDVHDISILTKTKKGRIGSLLYRIAKIDEQFFWIAK